VRGAAPRGGRARVVGAAFALAVLCAGLMLARAEPDALAQGAGVPNVIVVMTDDQRRGDMLALPETRQLIGRRGVTFNRSWATFPLCCPSRATNLTGQYAHNHGVRSNMPPNGGVVAFDDSATTTTALNDAGYRTALIGKYLHGYGALAQQDPPYIPPGWDRWLGMGDPAFMWGWSQVVNGKLRRWGIGRPPREYQTDVLARQARSFVGSSLRRNDPFFLTVSTLAPHAERLRGAGVRPRVNPRPAPRHRHAYDHVPFPTTESFNERDVSDKPAWLQATPRLSATLRKQVRARYRDRLTSLGAVDDLVARIVDTLRDERALRDTLVIFTSDNGFLLGEHRLRGKDVAYKEASQVPLLVRGPGLPKRARVSAPVGNIDVAATIYDATGVEPAVEQDGVSLYDVADNPGEYRDRELLIETKQSVGVRTSDFLYVEHDGGDTELYDSHADPLELNSVHDDPAYAAIRSELAKRLDQLRDCEGEECR
jgi:N-acetylglucosamine-6-sulfatase